MLRLGIDKYDYKATFYLSAEEKEWAKKKTSQFDKRHFWLFVQRAKNRLKIGPKINSELFSPKLVVDSMISNLEHRGPDGNGIYISNHNLLALGHTRLSIFDLSELGKQPMQYMDRFSITFNGAIYNFLELRQELISKGYIFLNLRLILKSF